ncbi:MAG: cytochrome c biogenesis protein CcsA [Thermogutta sp.]
MVGAWTPATADDQAIDWSRWQRLPLFEDGRIKPLDSFARRTVEKVTGRAEPLLAPPIDRQGRTHTQHPLFPDGKSRRWPAVELLFSWLTEAEKWEDVPFLQAGHEELRERLLGLPLKDAEGHRLKYVSPSDVEKSMAFDAYLRDLAQRRKDVENRGQRFRMTGLDLQAARLWDAYATFRLLTYTPRPDAHPWFPDHINMSHPIPRRLERLVQSWEDIQSELQQLANIGLLPSLEQKSSGVNGDIPATASNTNSGEDNLISQLIQEFLPLVKAVDSEEVTISELDQALARLQPLMREIAIEVESLRNRAFAAENTDPSQQARLNTLRSNIRLLAEKTRRLADEIDVLLPMLYDTGSGPNVLPSLIPASIALTTDAGDPVSPWLSLGAVLYGSENVLRGYDMKEVSRLRNCFTLAAEAYRDHNSPDRAARVEKNLNEFVQALEQLGRAVEPERQRLPIGDSHRELLALTAYPPSGLTDREVFYNEFDPFRWSWMMNLLAFVVLIVGVGRLRHLSLYLGIFVLLLAQIVTTFGFALRVAISGWAPVTNMFESVVFTSLVIGLLAIWFVVQPLIGKAIRQAWVWVSVSREPLTWTKEFQELQGQGKLVGVVRAAAIVARIALGAVLFYYLALVPYDVGKSRAVFDLVPEITRSLGNPTLGSVSMNLLGWFVGICILAAIVWLVPRFILGMFLASVWTIPANFKTAGLGARLNQAMHRRPFAIAGAALAFLTAVIAYFTPVWDKGIEALQPVLRDRLWLFAHVLTVTAGYGAGLLAWGLGNMSLLYYLLGRYHTIRPGEIIQHGERHRSAGVQVQGAALIVVPPEPCFDLANYMYRAIQVAVILLTAGTILGGVWADRAWGRFWGWDPKEVWALISILVYMALLHGRYIGWVNTFGLAAGSVFGMISVVWAWYGTNYLMPAGLHAYAGESSGGGLYVVGAFTANLFLVALAWVRYRGETSKRREVLETEADSQPAVAQNHAQFPGTSAIANPEE